uniref:Uncharacterized protein n=1 Tax=Mycena chlorophos TaxID=658473 RepID=A0ABQ0KYN2_MYCCL|nr:predicted protein [Mycena chlorophos]
MEQMRLDQLEIQTRLDQLEAQLQAGSYSSQSAPWGTSPSPTQSPRAHVPPQSSSTRAAEGQRRTAEGQRRTAEGQRKTAEGQRKTPRERPSSVTKSGSNIVYVVFQGWTIGTMRTMDQVKASIADFRGFVFQGYPSVEDAERAYRVASKGGLTSTTSLPVGQLPVAIDMVPRSIRAPDLADARRMEGRALNDLWYVGYVTINPGVYPTWIECSMNSEWVVDGDWEKSASFEDASRAYVHAVGTKTTRVSYTPSEHGARQL